MMNLKYVLGFIGTMMFLFSQNVNAQEGELKNHIWTYQGKKSKQHLGGYLSLSGTYHSLDEEPTGFLGAKGGLTWNSKWGLGLMGQALWYDKALSEVVNDGAYHLQAGMAGLYVSYMIPIQDKWRVSFMLASGSGLALYQYDKDSREGKPWYEEIIDRETFTFMQPTVVIKRYLGGKWWLGAEVSYRSTSEINLVGMSTNFLNGVNPGISLTYGLF